MDCRRLLSAVCCFLFLHLAGAVPNLYGNAGHGCSATDPTLARLKRDVAHPVAFCNFWAARQRVLSPFKDLSLPAVSSVCSCVNASPTIVGPVPTATMGNARPYGRCSPADPAIVAVAGDVEDPAYFCWFWHSAPYVRVNSPFPLLSAPQVSSVCSCATQTPGLFSHETTIPLSPSTTTIASTTIKPTTTSAPAAATTTTTTTSQAAYSTSSISSTIKPTITTTRTASVSSVSTQTTTVTSSTPSASLPSSSSTSSVSVSIEGTENFMTAVTIAAPASVTLAPMVPSGINQATLSNLAPANASELYFEGTPADGSSSGTIALVTLAFQYPSVVLDYSSFVSSVSCSSTTMTVVFNSAAALSYSYTQWTAEVPLILITASSSCGSTGTNALFLAKSLSQGPGTSLTATGSLVSVSDVYAQMDLQLGEIVSASNASSTSSSPSCAAATSTAFPTAACGASFDQSLDNELTFYSGADADYQTVITKLAPGLASNSMRRRGWFSKAVAAVKTVVKTAAKVVAKVVATVTPPIVKKAVAAAVNVVKTIVKVVASVIPTVSASKSFSFSWNANTTNLQALKLTSSPWGQQLLVYEWVPNESDDEDEYKKWEDALSAIADDLTPGGADPKPSIDFFCVNCGFSGSIALTGAFSYKAGTGLTKAQVAMRGSLNAGLYIGIDAYAQWQRTFTHPVATVGLPGLEIPDIVAIGPYIEIAVQAGLNISAEGQLLMGADLDWSSIAVVLDAVDHSQSYASGFTPSLSQEITLTGDVTAVVSLGLPISLAFGVNLLNGKWDKALKLVNTPAIAAVATYSIEEDASATVLSNGTTITNHTTTVNNGDDCKGIEWSIELTDDTELNLFDLDNYQLHWWQSSALASGCIEKKAKSASSSTTTTTTTQTTIASTTPSPVIPTPTTAFRANTTTSTTTTTAATTTAPGWTGCATFPAVQSSDLIQFSATFGAATATLNAIARPSAAVPTSGSPGFARCVQSTGQWEVSGNQAPVSLNANRTCVDTPLNSWKLCMQKCVADNLFYGTNCQGVYWQSSTSTCLFWAYPIITAAGDCGTFSPNDVAGDVYTQAIAAPTTTTTTTTSTTTSATSVSVSSTGFVDSIVCPAQDGITFTDINGKVYQVKCGMDPENEDLGVSSTQTYTLPECMAVCDANPSCVGVAFDYDYTGNPTRLPSCYPKYAQGPYKANTTLSHRTDSAFLVSYLNSQQLAKRAISTTSTTTTTSSAASSATSAASTEVITFVNITDTTDQIAVRPGTDGNLYAVLANTTESAFSVDDNLIFGDAAGRLLHYYPSIMGNMSVSRLRLAAWGSIPLTANLISLTPMTVPGYTTPMLVALDTLGDYFFPVACSLVGQTGVKILLVKDSSADLSYLSAAELETTVMGGVVDECNPLALSAAGLVGF
ncbi:hypothetical protein ANO11243_034780 [Dothideomycetidae sp. 11243]|nr:hypothetical protein ANO11243_034780 [fungal sp. No.11243]